mmetsp:Transcript_19826/g.25861  ORF Transcript_19826/g.25861 Transcript_19826/m.25861 type:complete len:249 (-) Transcript_19826:158-904(-)
MPLRILLLKEHFDMLPKGYIQMVRERTRTVFVNGSKQEQHLKKVFFSLDIKAFQKASHIVKAFNSANFVDKLIRINEPSVWTFQDGNDQWSGSKVLQEPYVENYQKFNSNTGWNDDDETPWPQVMQALSHFSYHSSGGQFVLCDLQGGIYSDGIVLTDPVILSRSKAYGVTDLGSKGISTFFSRHYCNQYCRHNWTKPNDTTSYFRESSGTSMIESQNHVPYRNSRPQMSALNEYDQSDDSDESDDYY